MLSDLKLSVRQLTHAPGFTLIALLTLALGIGLNTSMFSVLNALLFRSAPFPEPDQLVQVVATTPAGENRAFSVIELDEIIPAAEGSFAGLTSLALTQYSLATGNGEPPQRIGGTAVSEGFFRTFQVQPLLGRGFAPEEFHPGRNQVVLLSHSYWQQRYGGVPDIVGQTLRLDGENVTIIGVMPPHFDYRPLWGDAALWRPLNFTRDQREWRDYRMFLLFGRLRASASPTQAATSLAPLASAQEQSHPESYAGLRYRILPLHEALMDTLNRQLSWMLQGLAAFVLLIACANLANLQLARATRHLRDFGVRAALGASRWQLLRQQLLLSVLLGIGGGTLGLAVAVALNHLANRQSFFGSSGQEFVLEGRIFLLTLLVSVVVGVLFGLLPGWLAARADANSALKQQTRGSSAGRGTHRIRELLIVGEVALALVLLAGAAILHRGFAQLLERQTGWDTEQILSATLPVPESRISDNLERVELYRRMEERLRRLPSVEEAAIATSLPVYGYNGERQILTEADTPGDPALPTALHVMVTPSVFATLGIPLLEGRLFPAEIQPTDPRVIVINEALARRLWPGRSALGQRLASMDSGRPYWAEVIGVVRNVDSAAAVRDPATPFQVYKPLVHEPWSYVHLVVRSPAPAALTESLRRAVAEVDADLGVAQVGTVRQQVDWQQRNLVLAARALSAFALAGLALAALGLYGVISQLVAQRTSEFGIRLALGAQPSDVLQLVLSRGLTLTIAGLVLGSAGAWALAQVLASFLPRMAHLDPLALGAVCLLLLAAAGAACWLPARRATRVDPTIALRAE
jgi:putative ABC transport system permease protein